MINKNTSVYTNDGVYSIGTIKKGSKLQKDNYLENIEWLEKGTNTYILSNGFEINTNYDLDLDFDPIKSFSQNNIGEYEEGYIIGYHYSVEDYKKKFRDACKILVEKRYLDSICTCMNKYYSYIESHKIWGDNIPIKNYVILKSNLDYYSVIFYPDINYYLSKYGYDFLNYPFKLFKMNNSFINGFLKGYIEQRLNFARIRNNRKYPNYFYIDNKDYIIITTILGLLNCPITYIWESSKKIPCWMLKFGDDFYDAVLNGNFFCDYNNKLTVKTIKESQNSELCVSVKSKLGKIITPYANILV